MRNERARGNRTAVSRADTRHIFGTVFATSPRFMRGPICSRMPSTRAFSATFLSSCSGVSLPERRDRARITTPACRCRCTSLRYDRVDDRAGRSSAPQLEPATSRNSMGIAAAVPGTPSMRASPRTRPCRPAWTRRQRNAARVPCECVRESSAGRRDQAILDRPRSTGGEQIAAVLAVADFRLVDDDLQEQ